METVVAFALLALATVVLVWVGFIILKGVIRAFRRCWWLALIMLIILPALLIGWAIGEILFGDDDLTTNRREE